MVYIQPWHGSGLRLWEVSPLLGKIVLLTIVILGEILCMAGEDYWAFVDNQPKLMWNTNRFWTEWWRSPWSIFCLSARWQSQGGRGDDFTSRDPVHQDPVCEWCWTTDIIGDAFVVYQQPDNFIFPYGKMPYWVVGWDPGTGGWYDFMNVILPVAGKVEHAIGLRLCMGLWKSSDSVEQM